MQARRVIVVGSGPAGASAAEFLCRAGAEVLLLEAGVRRRLLGLTARVGGLTIAKYRPPLGYRAGVTATGDPTARLYEELSPGGLSNHWSCAVPRFAREDFADAERGGEAYAWPLGYDDLAPWYERVEPLLCIAGSREDREQLPAGNVRETRELAPDWEAVVRAAERDGRTVLPMPYAYGAATTLTTAGTVFNAFVRLIRPRERDGSLTVRYGARVLRLDYAPSTGRVEGVVVRDRLTGSEERLSCRAVVLAAGAVNSAQVLLESKCKDFPNGLGNTHDVLGRYLHDHPLGKLVIDLGAPKPVIPAAYVTRPNLERSTPLYAAACMQWAGAGAVTRSALHGRPGRMPWIGFSVFGTMKPLESGRVALDPTKPRIDGASALTLHVSHSPEAISALEEARDQTLDMLGRAGWEPKLRVWKVEPPCNSVHYGGTCRMHASPRFGMLNALGRLYAVPNVVVADSAAFTTGPEKNPVLTSMTLAARAGHHLAHDIASGDL